MNTTTSAASGLPALEIARPVSAFTQTHGSVIVRESDGSIKLPQFRFLAFNDHRSRRRVPAARVEIIPSLLDQDDEPPFWLWMTKRDIERNVKEFGPHPELLKALACYSRNMKLSNAGQPSPAQPNDPRPGVAL